MPDLSGALVREVSETAPFSAFTSVSATDYEFVWNGANGSGRGQVALYQSRMFGLLSHDFAADNPTGGFSTQDLALSLGIARRFEPFSGRRFEDERSLRAGAAVKLIRQSVPGSQTSAVERAPCISQEQGLY